MLPEKYFLPMKSSLKDKINDLEESLVTVFLSINYNKHLGTLLETQRLC